MLGGNYTLHRKTQERLGNGDMLTPRMKTEKWWRPKKKSRFRWVPLSCWFPFETSHCTSRRRSSFPFRLKGFLNPLNAYHGNAAAVGKMATLHNGSSGYKLINKTRGTHVHERQRILSLPDVLRLINWLVYWADGEQKKKKWQLCHCVLLLPFEMSDKCQPPHSLAFS